MTFRLFCATLLIASAAAAPRHAIEVRTAPNAAIFRGTQDISARDLFYGPGGKKHQPRGPFVFLKEDLDGTNPKFVVRDAEGVKWKVKLGPEARPESAASRLVWGAGYYTDDDYFLPSIHVDELPQHLKRGESLRRPNGTFHNVRLKRRPGGDEKMGDWKWRDNPLAGTRELNGLRVIMALINNWDLKDENNVLLEARKDSGRQFYVVSDLGASFGATHLTGNHHVDKDNLHSYEHSKFITGETATTVSFATPGAPSPIFVFTPFQYISRLRIKSVGKEIPIQDARWIGHVLAQLTPAQIRDAFRASGYTPREVEGFATIVRERINALNRL